MSPGRRGARTVSIQHDTLVTGGFSPRHSNYAVFVYQKEDEPEPHGLPSDTVCNGSILRTGEHLEAGESICTSVDGETVYYGVRVYPDSNFYQVELWSEKGTFEKAFGGVYSSNDHDAPFLRLQGDGHLVFNRKTSVTKDCRAKPNKRGSQTKATIGGPPDILKVVDDDGDLIWKLSYDGANIVTSDVCYPEIGSKCLDVLHEGTILTWDQYVCEYDSSGNVVTRFGLDQYGVLGLWRNDELMWKSIGGEYPGDLFEMHVDWLNLQPDGHLTSYKGKEPNLTYKWKSNCFGDGTKLVVVDGDVHQFDKDGSPVWCLAGDTNPQPKCFSPC